MVLKRRFLHFVNESKPNGRLDLVIDKDQADSDMFSNPTTKAINGYASEGMLETSMRRSAARVKPERVEKHPYSMRNVSMMFYVVVAFWKFWEILT